MAQAVSLPVKLAEGRELMPNGARNTLCAERAVFLEELSLRLTQRHFCSFLYVVPHDLLSWLPLDINV